MLRSTLGVLLCLCLPGALAQTLTQRAERDEVVMVDSDDPAMNKAFARARSGLDNFLRDAASSSSTNTGHAVKVRLTDGSKTEYFWVGDVRPAGPDFTGRLDNEPRNVKTVRYGERFRFKRADIVDWLYYDPMGRMHGSFTTCVLASKEKPAEARALLQQIRLSCD